MSEPCLAGRALEGVEGGAQHPASQATDPASCPVGSARPSELVAGS